MARDYFDESKKKKKKETTQVQKVAKSPSVSQTNNNVNKKASKSTFMGGGSAVRNTEKTVSRSTTNRTQSFSSNNQPVKRQPVGSRTNSSRLTAAQRQKMGLNDQATPEDRRSWREKSQARQEQARIKKMGLAPEDQPTAAQKKATDRALRNTPSIIKESAKGAAYGHLTTLNDIASIKSQGNGKSREEVYDPALAERSRQQAEQRVKKFQGKTQETEDALQKLTKNAKGLEKAYYGAVESGTGMLTDIGIGALTGTGQVGSLAAMASRTYGATRGKAQKEGATEAEDRAYAAAQAAKEVGTELMFPGAGLARGYAGKSGLKLADTAANILTKNLRGKAADIGGAGVRLLGGVAEENAEEIAGWGLDPLIKEITYGKNTRTRNAQQAMKERSNALRAEIQNEDDARAAAAYLSSDDFFEQTVNAYREAGLNKKDAEEVADRMRDYLTASLTGDTDSMEQIEDEVSKKVAGSKKLEWDFDELKDTIASTTLLTAATGLPGTGMTAVKGAALRDQLGDDGVRALANTAIDFEDGEMSLKAQAMKDRLDSGKELTGTQVYDLQVGMQEQIRKDTQREESSRRMADKRIKSDNLLTPYRQNENGGIDLDEATEASYREHVSRAKDIIDGLTSETKESLTANEKVDGSKAIAGFQTGVFTIEDANTLNYSNTTVRAAFEEATGVDLGSYVVKNKDGSVNIPATNTKTKDALFAMAADNLVKSAQAETANWMDNTKGQVVTQVSARMGAQGSAVLQQALDDVDERDRSKYMMTANATDMLYQAARNMGTEWSDVASEATKMFPGISESKLQMMYEAGLADREMANDKARGRQVRMGQALTEMGEQETATGKVFIDTEVPVKGSVIRTFTEIAKNLGADIHFVDYIYDADNNPIEGANGSYDPNTNTFYLNVATGAETNIGYIFMHETTHYLKTYAPEQYQALENLVRERWFAFNPSQMQDAIARKIEAYKRATKGRQVLTEEQALEEIIADASHDFINDPEFAKQVAEEDMGLAKAVLDSIRNALRMLRRIFASGSIDDDTHMNSLFRELDIMAEAEKLWLDAYKVAVQNSAINAVDNWQNKVNEKSATEPIEKKQSFSISKPIERVKDLIAVHNLNEEDLVGNLGLGGFPMPSIAITKDSMGHEKYGDISLLFHSDTIDPAVTNANQVFGGDAYTPTFPTVHYKANSKVSKKLVDMYYNNSNTLGYDAMRPMYEYAVTIDDTLDRAGGEAKLIEKAKKDTALMRLYLRMNDKDVETITTSTTTSLSDAEVERNDFWINELGKDAILEARPSDLKGREAMQHFANWRDERFDELKKAYEKLCREVYGFDDAEIKEVMADEKTVKKEISSNIVAASLYLKNGRDTTKTEIDYVATNKLVEETAKANGYDAWVDDLFKGIEEKSGIRNDKDWYTPAGNRRSWESLHEPVTLDNVVRQMKKELDSGGGTFLGNNPVGAAQKKYKSLDEIRADEDRLQYLDDENYGKLREQATAKLSKVAHEIYENSPKRMNSYAMFGAIDVGSDVAEALNKTRNKDKLKKILERDYSYNVSEQNMDDLMDALHDLANLPTGYFEAKPKRAVRFNEVKAAIVPEGFADHLKAQLSTYGTSIYEYNPEIEGDRTEKVNQAASENDLRFSISEKYDDDYMAAVNSGNMDEAQRLVDEAAKMAGYVESVYHGTGEYFNVFRLGREGIHLGNIEQAEQVARNRYHDRSRETRYKWGEIKDRISEMDTEARQSLINRLERTSAHAPIFDGDISDDESVKAYAEDALQKHYGTQTDINNKSVLMRTFDRNVGENVMRMYARLDNPFVINGDILDWTPWNIADTLLRKADGNTEYHDDFTGRRIDISGSDLNLGKWTRTAVERIANGEVKGDEAWRLLDGVLEQAGGYHGIKYLNQFEGDKNSYSYIALNRSDVKLADPVTYAEDGSVIPLSERFDPSNNDIRYSLPTQDSDGNILTDGQMEYFKSSQARDSEGKMQVVYHTTNKGGFTIFDPSYSDDRRSLFFASNFDVSQTYGRNANKPIDIYNDINSASTNTLIDRVNNTTAWNIDRVATEEDFENEIKRVTLTDDDAKKFGLPKDRIEKSKEYVKTLKDMLERMRGGEDFFYSEYNAIGHSYGANSMIATKQEVIDLIQSYGKGTQGYYSCYLNLENPLVVDAEGHNWNDVPYSSVSKADVIEKMRHYSSIIIQRISGHWQRNGNVYRLIIEGERKNEEGILEPFKVDKNILLNEHGINDFFDFEQKKTVKGLISEVWRDNVGEAEGFRKFINRQMADIDGTGHFSYSQKVNVAGEEFDFGGAYFTTDGHELYPSLYGYKMQKYRTRELAEIAQEAGRDGVIIRNCRDIGGASNLKGGNPISDIFIAFSSNQVKDINNENPTENPDIRYSFSDEDDLYSYMASVAADSMTNEELAYYEQIAETEEKHNDYLGKMRKWSEEKISEFYESLVSNDEMPSENEKTEEGRIRMSKAREDFFNSLDAKWNDKWLSNGEVLDLKSVKPRIKQLIMAQMRGANATRQYKTEVLNRTLFDVRTAYMMAKRGRIEVADEIIWNSARNMIANLEFVEERADYETFKEIRDFVKGHRIQIDEGDFPSHDHYKQFLKSNFGRMTLVKDGTGVDQVWQALNEKYGNLFPEDVVSPLNQLEWIADYLDSYEPVRWAYSSEEAATLAFDIADELGNIVFGYGKPIESLADHYKNKYEEKAKALKARCVEAERELRKTRRENESNEAKIARLQEKNQRIEKKLADEKQKAKDKAAKKKDIKERARYTGRIQKNYDWLTKRLLQPTKDKNIPEGFRKDLARLLCMFDLQTERSKELEQKYGIPSQKTFKMWDLHSKLCNVMNEDNGGIFQTNAYIEFLSENLAKRIDGKSIDSLETPDLLAVDEYLKIIVHQFREYDKVRVGEKRVKLEDLGGKVIQESDDRVSKRGQSKEYGGLIKALDSVVNFAELTPIHFFQRMGTMYTMYKEVRKSFDKYIRNEKYLLNKIQNICGDYYTQKKNRPGSELEAWRDSRSAQELRLKNGTVTMTVAQMMSLYCLSKRNQALLHMTKDGIVITPISEGAKIEKARADIKGRKEQIHSIQLTLADIDLIKTKLTPDQMKIADKLQELMSGEMAEWGNEMSMKLYGIRMFKEKDYFPIKVSSRVTEKNLDDIDITETIKNFGFTKPTQPNARNAIEVDDIFKVVADHCNNMNLYNAYGESISDFWRVFNYKQYSDEGKPTKTVQQALEEAYGKKAIKYIKNFIKDINGNVAGKRSGGLEEALNATLGRAKKAAVFGNMRVALQQPTAIVRAFAVLSPKYIGAIRVHKGAMQEMFEHCPIAQWKSWGFYDTYMGRDIEDVMMNKWSMSDTALSGIYGQLDNITWTAIWQMCKAEVKDTHPNVKEGTQEFWDLCNERASEVFDKTQVVDSPFHRSDAMRSKDIMVKSLTSFQAEPTLTFNVVRSGFAEAADALRNGNRTECTKKVAGTVAVFVAQAAVVSATAAIWDAVRRKNPDGGDDDDKKWIEFWTMNFFNNLKDNINLLNNIYLVKEIMPYIDKAFFGGYGASNNLLFQSLDTLTNGITQFQKKLEKGDAYDKSWYDVLTNLFGGFGYMFGIPAKTLMKDFKGITSWLGINVLAADEASLMDSVAEKMGYKPIDKTTENKWFDYERNPLKVKDGSAFDNVLNHFGWNLTEREKEQIAADEAAKAQAAKAEEIAGKTADLTGEAKDKKVWSYVTSYMKGENGDKPLADVIQEGDYKKVQEYRDMYVAAGGDTEYFDERIFATSKSAMKKTIIYDPTDAQIEAQENIKDYLLEHGMTDYELSEMAYKSNTAKDMKIAFMINDKDAMLETLEPLVRAGLSYEDLERIWDNRNRIDVMKYKSSKGRYADRLKSTGKFIWPTNGQITSYFGYRNAPTRGASSNHPAIDIGAPMGAEVVASDGGVVISAGWNGGYGNSVGIKHDNGMVTYYNHLSAWNVKEGDTVAQGQPIANVGSTGVSTGPHLDFKVLDSNGKPVDPLKYLASRS